MAKWKNQARLRLATNYGKRVEPSCDGLSTLHGHLGKAELAATQGLDLPGSALGNFLVPHTHGFPADTENISKRLMRTTEVIENLFEGDHAGSVSTLPQSVKRLTRGRRSPKGKLAYMSRKQKDEWSAKRGVAMRAARLALNYSQQKVADLAGVKDRETISQYESGAILDIGPTVIPRLAKALGMAVQALSREDIDVRDEGAALKVSPVARSIALNWDGYPQILQNHIRHLLTGYDRVAKEFGAEAATAMYANTLPPTPQHGNVVPIREKKRKAGR